MTAEKPDRLWESCVVGSEGRLHAEGEGRVYLGELFTISANGMLIEVIAVSVTNGRTWVAQDVQSFENDRRDRRAATGVDLRPLTAAASR